MIFIITSEILKLLEHENIIKFIIDNMNSIQR